MTKMAETTETTDNGEEVPRFIRGVFKEPAETTETEAAILRQIGQEPCDCEVCAYAGSCIEPPYVSTLRELEDRQEEGLLDISPDNERALRIYQRRIGLEAR